MQRVAAVSNNITKFREKLGGVSTRSSKAGGGKSSKEVEIQWHQSLKNEVQALLSTYLVGGTKWPLESLQKLLVKHDPDLEHQPDATFNGLHSVIDINKVCGDEDAQRALSDVKVRQV